MILGAGAVVLVGVGGKTTVEQIVKYIYQVQRCPSTAEVVASSTEASAASLEKEKSYLALSNNCYWRNLVTSNLAYSEPVEVNEISSNSNIILQ